MRFLILTAALLMAAPALAEETRVYRWTDDNGVVHFSTTPPPTSTEGVEEQMVREAPSPGSVAPTLKVGPEDETGITEAPQLDDLRARRDQDEQRRLICERARQRVAAIEPAQRVLIEKSDGSQQWLYGDDRIAELNRQRQLVEENCPKPRR